MRVEDVLEREQNPLRRMTRPRRHQRILAWLAFGLLALAAEIIGRSLTHRLDFGRHVSTPSYSSADYYPMLLVAVKLAVALMLARLLWRFIRARAAARAGRRLLAAVGKEARRTPRVRIELSPRLWLGCFLLTSTIFLFQTDMERLAGSRWPLLGPWLHSSALPAFAVVSVFMAVIWRAVAAWLSDYESYAEELVAQAERLSVATAPAVWTAVEGSTAPRRLFGLAFESRPPPLPG
jgi:hypothetical protein